MNGLRWRYTNGSVPDAQHTSLRRMYGANGTCAARDEHIGLRLKWSHPAWTPSELPAGPWQRTCAIGDLRRYGPPVLESWALPFWDPRAPRRRLIIMLRYQIRSPEVEEGCACARFRGPTRWRARIHVLVSLPPRLPSWVEFQIFGWDGPKLYKYGMRIEGATHW